MGGLARPGGAFATGDLSRRDFIKRSARASGALGALAALGVSLAPIQARAQALRIGAARATPGVCPYCAVGCGTIVHTVGGRIVNVEGNPDSPISEGNLCPKGAAIYQLVVNERRWTTVRYRAAGSDHWEDKPLGWAMERIAALVKKTRDETFQEQTDDGKTLMSSLSIFSLGGATLDNEWNYAHSKLMRGLGSSRSRTRPGYDTARQSPVWGLALVGGRRPSSRAT